MSLSTASKSSCLFLPSTSCTYKGESEVCSGCERLLKTCPECGSTNRPIARFCRRCRHTFSLQAPWAMMGGNPERQSNCSKYHIESAKNATNASPWEFERAPSSYAEGEIAHFYPQPVWTEEVLVLQGYDRHNHQEPHLCVLAPNSGRHLDSLSHLWENSLSYSLVSNSVDLWARSLNQLCHYSLLHGLSLQKKVSFPPQTQIAPHAAPLWLQPQGESAQTGFLCFLEQAQILRFYRDLQEAPPIPLAWKNAELSNYRSLCGAWPYLLAISGQGHFHLLQFHHTGSDVTTLAEGQLPQISNALQQHYAAPVFADGQFWIEVLFTEQEHIGRSPLREAQTALIALSPQAPTPRLFRLATTIRYENKDLQISFRYSPLYDAPNKSLLLYSGLHPDRASIRLFSLENQKENSVSTAFKSLPRYKANLTERAMLMADSARCSINEISLTTGIHHEQTLMNQLASKKIDGGLIRKGHRLFIPLQDRYLCIHTPNR